MHYAASSIPGEGPHVAVLVLIIDTQKKEIQKATVTSVNPAIHDCRYRYAEVVRATGYSYDEARKRLLEYVRKHDSWILPLLDEQ
jgi:hypothetical protein